MNNLVTLLPSSVGLGQAVDPLDPINDVVTPDIEWNLLWPFILLSIGGVLLITITSLIPAARTRGFPALMTTTLALISLVFLPWMSDQVAESPDRRLYAVSNALAIDGFTVWVFGVICVGLALVALLLDDYLRREGLDGPEWYVLLLMSASGGMLLAAGEDLIVTFLGLEILSIAVYVLAALHLRRSESQEAGFKYFALGAVSSAIFLYGIAMTYGATGSTRLSQIAVNIDSVGVAGIVPRNGASLVLVAMALLLVGFGFKVSAAPFHMWTPDVYQGAPTPVVAFMASVVKVAGFAGMLRVFINGFSKLESDWRPIVGAMAVVTLLIGAFLAVVQSNVKRMLAYSSITHAGFMLVALHAVGDADDVTAGLGGEAISFYMLAYTLMVIGTFAVVTVVGGAGDGNHSLDDYRGLSRRSPALAGVMAVLLFAQAGIPFTSGFFAKFRVIAAAADGQQYLLAGVAMVAAVVAAYLYLRVIVAMFMAETDGAEEASTDEADDASAETPDDEAAGEGVLDELDVPPAVMLVLAVAVIGTLVLGIFPDIVGDALTDASLTLSLLR